MHMIMNRILLRDELANAVQCGRPRDKDGRDAPHPPSMRSNFVRADAPLLIETAALLQPKCRATSSISSSFARPSTGLALT